MKVGTLVECIDGAFSPKQIRVLNYKDDKGFNHVEQGHVVLIR